QSIVEPVETSYFVRVVICTITSSYTTLISHHVLSLFTVRGSRNRTNCFSWCMVTMLTDHRLKNNISIFCCWFDKYFVLSFLHQIFFQCHFLCQCIVCNIRVVTVNS